MTFNIEPDTFDVIVVGSGLPECLIASSCIKSGKSVLIIDAVDTYGSDFSSFTLAALHSTARKPAAAGAGPETRGADSSSSSPDVQHEHSIPSPLQPLPSPPPAGCSLRRLQHRPLPIHGLRTFCASSEASSSSAPQLAQARSYILDLAPKLLYQGEALVDVMVHTRCHHYLEFKLVDGSYILQDGALRTVPASRSDVFKDRGLGLKDKRALMKFIGACMGPAQAEGGGSGSSGSQPAVGGCSPLVDALQAEGLSEALQDVVLYGIAMAPTAQRQPCQQQQQQRDGPACTSGAGGEAPDQQQQQQRRPWRPAGPLVTAAEGAAALQLFASSLGRFGQQGAFMVPSYGCGSIAEAFVRFSAVQGAVTVLRQPVQALLVEGQDEGGSGRCSGVVTGNGQVVRCSTLVASASTLAGLEGLEGAADTTRVSRAIAVLDRPLVEGQSILTLCVPPGAVPPPPLPAAAAAAVPLEPVRGLQLGPGCCVCPPGRYLLYLSAPAVSACAVKDLWATLGALADTAGLAEQQQQEAAAAPDAAAAAPAGSAEAAAARPRVVAAYFYQQELTAAVGADGIGIGGTLPAGVVATCGPSGSMVGYCAEVEAARQLCSEALQGVSWIKDMPMEQPEAAAGGADSDEDAIDELTAALSQLGGSGGAGGDPVAAGAAAPDGGAAVAQEAEAVDASSGERA